eukprot:TRINITY_DN9148_c0_g1_i5.p1 TRINITY_DN9148_c0_g1~~TRINITY_DN9148_c0_g1_i5.p1  ORF type:complete len:385 (+),score=56.24 TRINITY_DN9148_c0_g1_i5:375-1529(+)
MLYNGQGKFHHSITDTMDYVVDEAETTVEGLRNVTDIISLALVNSVDELFLSIAEQRKVDSLNRKLKTAANTLESKTHDNAHRIKRVLQTVRIVLIVLAAVMLLLAFVGLLFSMRGYKTLVYSLVLFAWILVTATFLLSGVFVLLTNVVGDACVSMDEWVAHPYANTSLDEILPCVDVETAKQSLTQSKEVTYKVVNVINIVITTVLNSNQSGSSIVNYNQSGPPIPTLCNPYTSQLEERNCSAGEVRLEDAPEAWKNYTCSVSSSGNCATRGRLTPAIYNELVVAVQISYGLYHYAPFLISLEDCSFVRDAFRNVSHDYCPGLRKQLRWVYIGLTFVATGILLSIVFWVVYSKQRTRRDQFFETQHDQSTRKADTADDKTAEN